METPTDFQSVIDLWPTKSAMQADLERHAPGDHGAAPRLWYKRKRIPPKWFDAIIKAAAEREFDGVTYASLTAMFRATHAQTTIEHEPADPPEAI